VVVVVFFVAVFALVAGAELSTTGVVTTGVVTTVGAVVFLDTVFLEAGAEVFIILEAVELFMAIIRTFFCAMESIFGPSFIFCRVRIFYSKFITV
jgi:hypothetical protein